MYLNKENTDRVDKMYREIVEYGLVDADALDIITVMCGYTEETLNNVVHYLTGYDFDEWLES